MKVVRAKILGFCMGVRRAVELTSAEANASASSGSAVFTLGSLIHNPKVLNDLEKRGVKALNELPETCENCSVIIRAHGINPAAENDLRSRGCRIVDATCPKVKMSQLKTRELSGAGYSLFLAGEAHHAEIEGILGYVDAAAFCMVVSGADEAQNAAAELYKVNSGAKAALLGQTTISEDEYSNIANEIKKYFPSLEIAKTICAATTERQQALRELLLETDAVIIAGGRESANTRRLLAIAKESGKPCALTESSDEIPLEFFNFKTVGLCAGASTPDILIDEIEAVLLASTR
ncbi:MAG: 4-hydroxy-3-methylbut-2-enyl diphosphate reductase [Treponema sp.]|nr:4-hydroxy-3-methylbut-2-enyl diphosphate reductase [Treponema sp.]